MYFTIEFGGGVDSLLLGNHRLLHFKLSNSDTLSGEDSCEVTIGNVLAFIRQNLASSQPDLLASSPSNTSQSVKFNVNIEEIDKTFTLDTGAFSDPAPGVIILVNERDYELTGGSSCKILSGQNIAIISTLHGG